MALMPAVLRQAVRALLIVLRSVPELIWALVFVRVVGLGPTAGVLAIALTYGGMLGKVYGEILESGEAHATDQPAAQWQRAPAGLLLRPAAAERRRAHQLHRVPMGMRHPLVRRAGLRRRRRTGPA